MLTHSPAPQPTRIIVEPGDVAARLLSLDAVLTEALLLEANQRGFEARLDVTRAHAPTAAGTFHWHAFVAALRLALIEEQWSMRDERNCPLVISPDRTMAIVVMTGNADTGKTFGNPTNQADKGAVLDEAVQRNIQYQLKHGTNNKPAPDHRTSLPLGGARRPRLAQTTHTQGPPPRRPPKRRSRPPPTRGNTE